MTLAPVGWLNGLTQAGLLIFACVLGIFFISKSKKTKANLLLYLGLGTLGVGFWQLAGTIDFVSILATETNLPIYVDSSNPIHSLFWFFTTLFEFIFGIAFLYYVALHLVVPNKKYYFLALFIIISTAISLLYIFDFNNNIVTTDINLGEDIINTLAIMGSPIFYLMIADVLLFFGFNVIGLILKSIQSKGIVKNKFLELSIGNLLLLAFFVVYAVVPDTILKLIMRIGEIGSIVVIYFSLRESPEKSEKVRPKKEVKVEDGLFRLIKRPDVITEEEVSISKEKKICLVCKGKVLSFSFICPECETFYCEKCARAMIDLENVCWACDNPLDASKPFKSYQEKGEFSGEPTIAEEHLKK
ncbi:MAG: B-box zinc finger protein [Candidatus Hermodarchaeota archaeon]